MSSVSDTYHIYNITPTQLWEQLEAKPSLLLPASIEKKSFGHYNEITGKRHGFQFEPMWQLLPSGPWSVLVELTDKKPAERVDYKITVDRESGILYTGKLMINLADLPASVDEEGGTSVTVQLDGKRKSELDEFSDELIETILHSLIREGWETTHLQITGKTQSNELVNAYEAEEDHMAPLAVAAGVFSAGMALSLWMWRRKKRKQSA